MGIAHRIRYSFLHRNDSLWDVATRLTQYIDRIRQDLQNVPADKDVIRLFEDLDKLEDLLLKEILCQQSER